MGNSLATAAKEQGCESVEVESGGPWFSFFVCRFEFSLSPSINLSLPNPVLLNLLLKCGTNNEVSATQEVSCSFVSIFVSNCNRL